MWRICRAQSSSNPFQQPTASIARPNSHSLVVGHSSVHGLHLNAIQPKPVGGVIYARRQPASLQRKASMDDVLLTAWLAAAPSRRPRRSTHGLSIRDQTRSRDTSETASSVSRSPGNDVRRFVAGLRRLMAIVMAKRLGRHAESRDRYRRNSLETASLGSLTRASQQRHRSGKGPNRHESARIACCDAFTCETSITTSHSSPKTSPELAVISLPTTQTEELFTSLPPFLPLLSLFLSFY